MQGRWTDFKRKHFQKILFRWWPNMGGEYSVDSCNGILTLKLFMINFISQVCPVLQLIIMINCLPWTLDHCLSSLAALSTCTLETTTLERGHHHILFHFWHTNTEQQKGLREDDYWKGFLRFNVQKTNLLLLNFIKFDNRTYQWYNHPHFRHTFKILRSKGSPWKTIA